MSGAEARAGAGRAATALHVRRWGRGRPVIALHPTALDSSAFAGVGPALAAHGLRTIAVDLPGFGRTPAPREPLTPARLAEPVVEMARRMRERPALVGMSMGGRVALEAALLEPEAFRAVVAIAPYLPWRRFRWVLQLAHLISRRAAEELPVEIAWPLLKRVADALDATPWVRNDEIVRAGVRAIYYSSCPATRGAIVSAAREMALDPAYGPRGLWVRLPALPMPVTFLWGMHDRLVPLSFARAVAEVFPEAHQRVLPCLGHAIHGEHLRCLVAALAEALGAGAAAGARAGRPPSIRACGSRAW